MKTSRGIAAENGYFQKLNTMTSTRFWVNNPTAKDIEKAIQAGAVSCTTNPAYCSKLLQNEPEYISGVLEKVVVETEDPNAAAEKVYHQTAVRIMREFEPLYTASGGTEGFVTIQDDPRLDHDAEHTVEVAMRCRELGPNFMAKIPVIEGGIEAIEELVAHDLPVCATEVFSISQAITICEVYKKACRKSGHNPPLYVTHITGIMDQYFGDLVKNEKIDIDPVVLSQAGTVIARKEYHLLKDRGYSVSLLGGGARGTQHFTELVGGALHVTINWSTAEEIIRDNPSITSRIDVPTPDEVVQELSAKLPGFRRAWKEDGMRPEEYANYGPVMFFKTMFLNGYSRLLDAVIETKSRK